MRIGTVAKRSGLSTRTIDYYTQMGLLSYSRSEANYRLYPESVLDKIEHIQKLKEARMTLHEIKEIMACKEEKTTAPTLNEVNEELEHLQSKLASLQSELEHASPEERRYAAQEIQLKMVPVLQMITTLLS
ncbi:MerR family transcriptional regulator [Jeotgalibacillus sp. R-1-5s-1]|uniref:MerR family transcriptional regulator n=1 Tax=Jeotgalibacillus sp. R-1-5s-1 TaxID=2555897 RepID=UPI00106C668D|nr:MerR family transcriptional regulator [Jeotgalibacillus sp. R-1-5s-1]